MKFLVVALALFAGQALSLNEKPVAHLKLHTNFIDAALGGSRLELSHGPPIVYLPTPAPPPDVDGNSWTIDVKNFGPDPVTVADRGSFKVPVAVSQTVHIVSNGRAYLLKH